MFPTRQSLDALLWYKRFAQSILHVDAGDITDNERINGMDIQSLRDVFLSDPPTSDSPRKAPANYHSICTGAEGYACAALAR